MLRSPTAAGDSGLTTTGTSPRTLSFPVPDKIDSPMQSNAQNTHRSSFGLNIGKFFFCSILGCKGVNVKVFSIFLDVALR